MCVQTQCTQKNNMNCCISPIFMRQIKYLEQLDGASMMVSNPVNIGAYCMGGDIVVLLTLQISWHYIAESPSAIFPGELNTTILSPQHGTTRCFPCAHDHKSLICCHFHHGWRVRLHQSSAEATLSHRVLRHSIFSGLCKLLQAVPAQWDTPANVDGGIDSSRTSNTAELIPKVASGC